MAPEISASAYGRRQKLGLLLGPALLLLTFVVPAPAGLSGEGWLVAGVAALMATWWICEPVPIPVTSLMPMVLLPVLGVAPIKEVASPYAHPLIFLFFGGFLIALAMERWGLHRRIALALIGIMGRKASHIVAGFMLAAALLSMWVSNTATSLMMLPIAMSVIALVEDQAMSKEARAGAADFSLVLLLSVAYSATIGGLGTLIGTPPNALLAAFLNQTYGYQIGFAQWMLLGVPLVLIGLPLTFLFLTRILFRLDKVEMSGVGSLIAVEREKLGALGRVEKNVAIVFAATAAAWVFRPLLQDWLPLLNDTTIAMAGGIALFLIPVDLSKGEFLMNWQTAKRLPWDVFLLFGGGLSLAAAIEGQGVASWIGSLFDGASAMPLLALVALVCICILLLTELTSNTATAATFLPVIAAMAISLGENPLLLAVPAALAASCSFMLPVGTPPNAIVFGSGKFTLPQMARAGVWLNIGFLVLIVAMAYWLAPIVFGIQHGVVPDWAA
ncbi:sodium-dependent dicarboxylate transporter 2/3/5 [Parvibaculum indicum]|uniref:SLC13 family permease n=1 Tax=Parvibaculum indicum TaxID=562969 RepID=UPI001422F8B6|nr:DASS family sodium-coupled anion symporter [Parvibaculum indicum]NIJ42652.1 sodium-dependent dicarboxylate transporter 2/3/5 [Parvibaculum indicum]